MLIIGVLGAIIVPLTSVLMITNVVSSIELFFSSLLLGYVLLFIILRYSIYYNANIELNTDYIKINDLKIPWDKLSSYDYDATPLFRKLKLRDSMGVQIKLAGRLHGDESIVIKEIVNSIKGQIDNINSNSEDDYVRIKQSNFYTSKFAKPVGYILIIAALILTIWVMIKGENNLSGELRLISFYMLLTLVLIRIFVDKK